MTESTSTTATRGHLLTVTKSSDLAEDDPVWDYAVTCLAPDQCSGWQECREAHVVDGMSAANGPHDCPAEDAAACLQPWCDRDEFEFHGVSHQWRWGYGWTVPFRGCVVAEEVHCGSGCDSAFDIAHEHGEGEHLVDDDWDDTTVTLYFVETLKPRAEAAR